MYFAKVGAVARLKPGGVHAADPVGLVDRRGALHGLDGLGRLRAIVVLDDLDLALAVLQLETAALVHLVRPKLIGREMGDRRTGRQRAGLGADHGDFDGRQSALAAR